MRVRGYGEPPPTFPAALGWAVLVMLLTWLVLSEYYRLTEPPDQVLIIVPADEEPPPSGGPGRDPGGERLPQALGAAGRAA